MQLAGVSGWGVAHLTAALVLFCGNVHAASQTANARLFCLSVRVAEAQTTALGLIYELRFSSYYSWSYPNQEFFNLLSQTAPTHASGFLLSEGALLGDLEGGMEITVPEEIDGDRDGVPDFYQVGRPIDVTTAAGYYEVYDSSGGVLDSGSVRTRWQRSAGSATGICTLTMSDGSLVPPLVFTHTFEIFEYAGTLTYEPASSDIHAFASLTGVANPQRTFRGPLPLRRSAEDPFDLLEVHSAQWTNALNEILEVRGGYLSRDMRFELEYFGLFSFEDGDPFTPHEPDYELFYLGIDDPNDTNGNGIPDLTDPPASGVSLQVALGTEGLMLTVSGQPGQACAIETTSNVSSTTWSTATTITLTQSTQTLSLPVPATGPAFWRARVL
jgi:hypothetical protein